MERKKEKEGKLPNEKRCGRKNTKAGHWSLECWSAEMSISESGRQQATYYKQYYSYRMWNWLQHTLHSQYVLFAVKSRCKCLSSGRHLRVSTHFMKISPQFNDEIWKNEMMKWCLCSWLLCFPCYGRQECSICLISALHFAVKTSTRHPFLQLMS